MSDGAVYIAGHPHDCATVVNGWSAVDDVEPGALPARRWRSRWRSAGTLKARSATSGYTSFGGQPSPTLLTWFPTFNTGTITGQNQGPWSVASNSGYVVYGGEFTTVNGQAHQGLVRFALTTDRNPADAASINKDGPRLSGADFVPALTVTAGKFTLKWTQNFDRDNALLTYTRGEGHD